MSRTPELHLINHMLNTSFSAVTEQFTVWVMALFWKKQISISLLYC